MAIPNALREKIEAAKRKNGGGGKIQRIKNGSFIAHVLPGEYGPEGLFYAKVVTHYLGEESVICPRTHDRKCEVCEYIGELKKSISELKIQLERAAKSDDKAAEREIESALASLEDENDNLYGRSDWLMNLLKKGDSEPAVYAVKYGIFEKVFNTFTTQVETADVDILDVAESYPFKFSRTGEGFKDTKYNAEVMLKGVPIAPTVEEIEAILKKAQDLNALSQPTPETEIYEIMEKYRRGELKKRDEKESKPSHSSGRSNDSPRRSEPSHSPQSSESKDVGEVSAADRLRQRLRERESQG